MTQSDHDALVEEVAQRRHDAAHAYGPRWETLLRMAVDSTEAEDIVEAWRTEARADLAVIAKRLETVTPAMRKAWIGKGRESLPIRLPYEEEGDAASDWHAMLAASPLVPGKQEQGDA